MFLGMCKKNLDPKSFEHFTGCLRKYKSQEITIQSVMNECIPLFLSIADTHLRNELLLEFEAFLPSKIKNEFQKSVQKLTSVLPSSSAKRFSSYVDARKPPLKLETGLEALIQRRASSSEKKPVETIVLTPEDQDALLQRKEAKRLREEEEEQAKKEEEEEKMKKRKEEPSSNAPKCTICQDVFKSPFSSNCGHVCCYSCWQSWLSEKLECPICKEKVRMKQLRKIYFL